MLSDPYTGLFEQVKRRLIERIIHIENDFHNSAVDNHFAAHQTGRKRGVDAAVLDTRPVVSRLRDGILLSVRAQAFIEPCSTAGQIIASWTAALIAVLRSAGSPIVSGG